MASTTYTIARATSTINSSKKKKQPRAHHPRVLVATESPFRKAGLGWREGLKTPSGFRFPTRWLERDIRTASPPPSASHKAREL